MKVLESIMHDALFTAHAKSYVQGVYLDEAHVAWCAENFAFWAGQHYGVVAMLLQGHVAVITMHGENGFIAVGRGILPDTPAGLFECIHLHTGHGYIVLYEGTTYVIKSALAGISEAVDDRAQAENRTLLH